MKITKKAHLVKWSLSYLFMFLFTLNIVGVYAQGLLVKGTVIGDEDNEPIPGVTVIVKGTTSGTVTDLDGHYSIKAKRGDILTFSFIGMKSYEEGVTGNRIDVVLQPDQIVLDEVVAIGYGSINKKESTGAVAQVKSEELERTLTSDVGSALQGHVAGVNVVSSSGAPGSKSDILIRGLSSIGGSNAPLYVVDGVPFDGDPGLNPNEIETIDILKDAASAAIYGTRGAAGVILVTTKQGKEGTLRVAANASYGFQDITSGTPLMNAAQQTYFDIVTDRNISGATDDIISLNLAKSPFSFVNDTDLRDIVFINNAAIQDYNVNVSGGSKDINYSIMVGYHSKDGVIRNSDFERLNTRANTRYKSGKWLINGSVGFSQETTNSALGSILVQSIKYLPTQPALDFDDDKSEIESMGGDEGVRLNWVMDSFRNTDTSNNTRAFGSLNANYQVFKKLELSTRVSVNYTNGYQHRFSPYQDIYDSFGKLISRPSDSYVRMDANRGTKTDLEAGLKYENKIKDHNFAFQAIYTLEEELQDRFYAKGAGVIDNDIKVLNGTSINPEIGSGFNWRTKQIGTLGRILYNYDKKYMLSVSARYDGSSKFGKNYRWGWFPSASGAWNISDETFWKPIKNTVNTFRLRLGRGTVGNNRFPAYAYSAGIGSGIDYGFGPESSTHLGLGSTQVQFANSDVKWETSIQWNGGIDIAMFSNKLNFTAEVYDTKKKDMLFPVLLPGSASGKSETVVLNVGDMTNRGLELALGYRTQLGKVKLNTNSTFSINRNKITKMAIEGDFNMTDDNGLISGAADYSKITVLAEGYEAGAFFLYTTDGIVDTHQKLAEYQKIDASARMGDLIYKDNNGDGRITELDRVYCGSGLSDYEIGFNVNAEYQSFDFSMQWYAALGHDIMNGSRATAYSFGRHRDLVYAWSEANPVTPIPAYRGDIKKHSNYRGYTDQWLEDGSYLRLKSVIFGYNLPKSFLMKAGVTKARVYVSAQNPLTFTKYKGFDPEVGGNVGSRGLDKGRYPITSIYAVGLNLNF